MNIILIVDDELENLKALKRALGDSNPSWNILTASTESKAEEILKNQILIKQPVEVVLTDLVMDTEKSGMNMLLKARSLDPLIMAILFTAKEKSLDRYAAFDYGAFDVVEKNIRGTSAVKEINIKTRAALRYRQWCMQVNYLRRYFDPRLFDTINKDPSLLALSQKTVTIVFWDIREFSLLCDSLKANPTLISGFLQEYFEQGAKIIFENGGVLDKFIGDSIMALFGALDPINDNGKSDAISAVKAAVSMRTQFDAISHTWVEKWKLYEPNKIEIGLGCGIHTGDVLVGNVGTDFRDQFTALGSHVNFASRIQTRSKSGQILLSQSTEARVKSTVRTSLFDTISDVKNIPGTFSIYKID